MDINDRIRMIIDSHKLTAGAFAEKIGVQRSNVSHILSGRNKPGYEFLEKVLLAFPKVQADWLMTGRQNREISPSVKDPQNIKEEAQGAYSSAQKQITFENRKETKKEIVKIVTFYNDFTFDTYQPNAE